MSTNKSRKPLIRSVLLCQNVPLRLTTGILLVCRAVGTALSEKNKSLNAFAAYKVDISSNREDY